MVQSHAREGSSCTRTPCTRAPCIRAPCKAILRRVAPVCIKQHVTYVSDKHMPGAGHATLLACSAQCYPCEYDVTSRAEGHTSLPRTSGALAPWPLLLPLSAKPRRDRSCSISFGTPALVSVMPSTRSCSTPEPSRPQSTRRHSHALRGLYRLSFVRSSGYWLGSPGAPRIEMAMGALPSFWTLATSSRAATTSAAGLGSTRVTFQAGFFDQGFTASKLPS
jgi:hypothetical protein